LKSIGAIGISWVDKILGPLAKALRRHESASMDTDIKGEYVTTHKFTAYFENEVLRKRSYLKKEWCIRIIENPIRVEVQGDNRVRFWGNVKEFHNLVFRVVT
jgi:hypothetical protein